jgi:hypothetical protein
MKPFSPSAAGYFSFTFEIVVEKKAENDGTWRIASPCLTASAMGKPLKMPNTVFGKPSSNISNLS